MSKTVYVSPSGNDASPGTPQQPVLTLARARDVLRDAGESESKRIILRDGEYYDVALQLEPQDSGLTIEAAPGETPVLYGGRRITGWRKDGEQLYAAPLPGVREGEWDFRMLEVNGRFCLRARLPAGGRFKHLTRFDVPWMSTTGGGWKRKPTETELTTLVYQPDDLGSWLKTRNAELTIYHSWDESLIGIASLDAATRTIIFSTPAGHPAGAFGNRDYVVWNVREGMTTPGQWYLDREAGEVVYWPLAGEVIDDAAVVAPTRESVISVTGTTEQPVTDVTLRGVTVAVTGTPLVAGGFSARYFAGAIALTETKDCRLTGVTVRNANGQGIKAVNSSGLRIDHCEIACTGAGGIIGNGAHSIVEYNHVHHCGMTYPSAPGISMSDAVIVHNDIHHIAYSAIIGGLRIESNLIYDFMKVMEDGGASYVGFCKDIVVRGNAYFGTGVAKMAHGLYIDEQAENFLEEGNLVVNTCWPSHNHMARGNTIRNNVFVDEGMSRLTFPRCSGFTFEKNIVVGQREVRFCMPDDAIASMPNNIFYSRDGAVLVERLEDYGGTGVSPLEPRDGSLIIDPLLVRGADGDYTPGAGSPTTRLGILPLDLQHVGCHGLATKKSFIAVRLEMLEQPRQAPDGAIRPGQARLLVENPGDVTATGIVDMWTLPSSAVQLSGTLPAVSYTLAPGEHLEQRFSVSITPNAPNELLISAQIRHDPNTGATLSFSVMREG